MVVLEMIVSKPDDLGFKSTRVRDKVRLRRSSFVSLRPICGTDAITKFKFCAQMHHGWLLPADQNYYYSLLRRKAAQKSQQWCCYYGGMRRMTQFPLKNLPLNLHNVLSNENVKWYFSDTSYNGLLIV